MAGQRKLPQWYLDKVNMAYDVFRGNPDGVDTSRPHVARLDRGTGVAAQRKGYLAPLHKGATSNPARAS